MIKFTDFTLIETRLRVSYILGYFIFLTFETARVHLLLPVPPWKMKSLERYTRILARGGASCRLIIIPLLPSEKKQ